MQYSNEWLLDQLRSGRTYDYIYFWGHQVPKDGQVRKSCLSQWYPAPFTAEGLDFATAEHYMMYHKALTAGDERSARRVLASQDPREAKALGRSVANYDDKQWKTVKYEIVVAGNVHKFGQNQALLDFLLATEDTVLVEASPYDTQWGIGMKAQEASTTHPKDWRGSNLLGWALMEARERLR